MHIYDCPSIVPCISRILTTFNLYSGRPRKFQFDTVAAAYGKLEEMDVSEWF